MKPLSPPTKPHRRLKPANENSKHGNMGWGPVLVVLLGIAAYSNSFRGAYVLDDYPNIVDSIEIRSLMPTRITLLGPPWTSYTGRPVAMFFLTLSYCLHGTEPLGYHMFNLAIHLVAALAIHAIVRRTLCLPRLQDLFASHANTLATIVATIWVVHPLTTAAVTYISQRVEALMALFYLLTIYFFLIAATSEKRSFKRKSSTMIASAVCLLGMFTKEPMVTAPVVALLLDRTLISGSFARALRERRWLYAGLAFTWIPLAILLSMHPHGNAVGYHFGDFTALDYLKSQSRSVVLYLKLSLWPSALVLYYGTAGYDLHVLRSINEYGPWAAVVIVLIGLTVWGLLRRNAAALLGGAFFLILAPSSSIMPMPSEMIAEHRMYLPLVAVVAFAVLGIYWLIDRLPSNAARGAAFKLACVGSVCGVIALAISTYRRNALYHSPLALWQDTLQKRPNSPTVLGEIGRLEMEAGDYDRAERHLRQSLTYWPNSPIPLIAYGQVMEKTGRTTEAIQQYELACSAAAEDLTAPYIYLADLFAKQQQLLPAVQVLQNAVQKNPNHAIARGLLGALLIRSGSRDAGESQFQELYRIVKDKAYGHLIVADALNGQGLAAMAEKELLEVQAISPEHPALPLRLGLIYQSRGEFERAGAEYRKGLAKQPNNISLLNNLAWIEAACPIDALRNGSHAVELGERAARVSERKNGSALDTLAAAYAETGQFDKAAATAEEALRLTNDPQIRDQAVDIQKRLELYRKRLPYHDPPPPTGSAAPTTHMMIKNRYAN